MKTAQIEDGRELSFPDDTPDEVMDQLVQMYLQAPKAAPREVQSPQAGGDDGGMIESLMAAFGQHAQNLQKNRIETRDATHDLAAAKLMQNAQHHGERLDSMNQLGGALGQGLATLTQSMEQIAENTAHSKEVILAVNNLSATILEVGKAVIRVLGQTKELYMDGAGKPLGVRAVPAKGLDGKLIT